MTAESVALPSSRYRPPPPQVVDADRLNEALRQLNETVCTYEAGNEERDAHLKAKNREIQDLRGRLEEARGAMVQVQAHLDGLCIGGARAEPRAAEANGRHAQFGLAEHATLVDALSAAVNASRL